MAGALRGTVIGSLGVRAKARLPLRSRLFLGKLKHAPRHTMPQWRRSHHSEKRNKDNNVKKTRGKFQRSFVSRTVTPASENGMASASFWRSLGFQ